MQTNLFEDPLNVLPFDGRAEWLPAFFSREESDRFLQTLTREIDWKQEPIKLFGKLIMQPRLTAWYGDDDKPYSYSGITMQAKPFTPALKLIKERIEPVAGCKFTSALLNLYRNGQDSMGWHRDNEKELGPEPIIASVSFGATRTFQFRNYADKKLIRSLQLSHGSLLIMRGVTNHFWEHRVPKTNTAVAPRINITFRIIH